MRTITFPNGRVLPAIGQGTWFLGDSPARRDDEIAALRAGLDAGLTLIDTAEMYGDGRSEELVGEAIRGRRDDVFLVSKVLPWNADAAGTRESLTASLRRLGTDRLDLYLLHWRGDVPLDETVEVFEQLVAEGMIGQWGVSNLDVDDMADLPGSPATDQVVYNPSRRGIEFDLLPMLQGRRIPAMAYSPLEQARLLGDRRLGAIAAELGVTTAQLLLAWAVRDGDVLAIPKAASPAHTAENVAALELELDADVLAAIDARFPPPTRPEPLEML